jgi:hypothetical protein
LKVAGFTFIKDAIKYDYPIVEAISSILPLCDMVIVAVGKSEDDTLNLIKSIQTDKIGIIETVWDETLREGGRVLALETDKAFAAIPGGYDWAFYIQGDEVVHEKYLESIKAGMVRYQNQKTVEGLLFKYLHFYGSYDYMGESSRWYRNEIRIIRPRRDIFSFKDAQGFRKLPNEKLNVARVDAYIYHYGWVKDPRAMQRKQENFHKYWHDDSWVDQNVIKASEFSYEKHLNYVVPFDGTHPEMMKERINTRNWKYDVDITINKKSVKDKFKSFMRKYFRLEIGYKNYKLIH